MQRLLLFALMLAFAAGVAAQAYRWVDKDGRVRYGDTPPPGVKASPLQLPQGGGANVVPSNTGAAGKAASKGPLSPAEQEAEFRKRQLEAQKSSEKDAQARQDAAARQENCARARETLNLYESGQRVARTGADGERYFVDDAQRAVETDKARQAVSESCG